MANKAISELPQALNVNNQDLFVLEQSGIAKKLPAETFITEQGIIDALAEALDGHGGIQSVTLSSVSGRIRTYRITFTDQSATTFQVYDGTSIDRISRTSSSGLDDVYTIFLSDGTTTFFTVHNGADGTVSEEMLNDALKNKAPAVTETTESSAIATFTDGADDLVMHNIVAEINPVQDLSNGDPSPSNICPITGHTEVNVTRTGKNLFDKTATNTSNGYAENSFLTSAGAISSNVSINISEYIKVSPSTDFVISGSVASGMNAPSVCFYDISKNFISGVAYSNRATIAFTTPANATYLRMSYNKDAKDNYQLELGSTATAYEPYQGNTVNLSWQTEAGTVYGGTIDVATGVLTVTHAMYSLSDLESVMSMQWSYDSTNQVFLLNKNVTNTGTGGADWNAACSVYGVKPYGYNSSYSGSDYVIWAHASSGSLRVRDSRFTTRSSFLAAVGSETLVYPLATSQTYQLTPQEVKTLLGTNNVWADTGNTSVTYPADTKMFIEKLTIPSEDDLVANQAITSGKYFMVGNSLYLALANIASGAQITIGTNAQRVSLADALNTINS